MQKISSNTCTKPIQVEMYAAIRFQRDVHEDDYIVPGGFTFVMKGETHTFDFLESSWNICKPKNDEIVCACVGLDKNSSDTAGEITEEHFKHIEKIEEFYVYVGEKGEPSYDLKPEELLGISIIVNNQNITVSTEVIEDINNNGQCSSRFTTLQKSS